MSAGVDLLPLLTPASACVRLRPRGAVVRQGRGVRPQDEDRLRHRRLPGALRRGADLAGALARGRAGADRRRPSTCAERPTWSDWPIVPLADLRRSRAASPRRTRSSTEPRATRSRPLVLAEIALDQGDASAAVICSSRCFGAIPAQNPSCGWLRGGDGEGEGRHRRGAALRTGAALARRGGGNAPAARLASSPRASGRCRRPGDSARAARGRGRAVRRAGAAFELGAGRLGCARLAAGRGDAADARRRWRSSVSTRSGPRRGGAGARAAGGPRDSTGAQARGALRSAPHSRELEVLRLVAEGLTDAKIAERLVLSRHTVHRHLQNAYARLGCSSRAAAVAEANRLKLL